ncbi:MAG: hypothetical protein ACKOXQ_05670 [Hydrogenophaga sp.]
MGIRIHRNTWRAPLQLIDSWLPAPTPPALARSVSVMAQRAVRASRMIRSSRLDATGLRTLGGQTQTASAVPGNPHRSPGMDAHTRPDARVVLSGRLSDVCAELDRLVALEPAITRH